MSPIVNDYRTFELVADRHVWIDFMKEGWPPVSAPASEAPPQGAHPSRMLAIRLRDNGGGANPTEGEMCDRTRGLWCAKVIEAGTGRVWLVASGPNWQTEPRKGGIENWPPSTDAPARPASDEFTIHVLPWRADCDHVLYECLDGCGAKLVVWRDKDGAEHRVHEGFESPAHEDDLWRRTESGYLHEWCRTGWRKECNARMRWQASRGKPDEAERLAEYEQLRAEREKREE
jgi:hypothetical protein